MGVKVCCLGHKILETQFLPPTTYCGMGSLILTPMCGPGVRPTNSQAAGAGKSTRHCALSAPGPGLAPDFSGRMLRETNIVSARAPMRQIENLGDSPGQASVIPAWKPAAPVLRARRPRPSFPDRRFRKRVGGRRLAGPNFSQVGLLESLAVQFRGMGVFRPCGLLPDGL
jgi:hypothetical protein